jgi:hypothetical protein
MGLILVFQRLRRIEGRRTENKKQTEVVALEEGDRL